MGHVRVRDFSRRHRDSTEEFMIALAGAVFGASLLIISALLEIRANEKKKRSHKSTRT